MLSQTSSSPPTKQPQATPWWERLIVRQTLGIALSVVAGTALVWIPQLWGSGDVVDSVGALFSVTIVSFVLLFAAGALLRSLWALLIAPVAWALGVIGALAVGVLTAGGGNWTEFGPMTITLLQLGVLPVLVATGLGILLGRGLQKRGYIGRTTREHGSLLA